MTSSIDKATSAVSNAVSSNAGQVTSGAVTTFKTVGRNLNKVIKKADIAFNKAKFESRKIFKEIQSVGEYIAEGNFDSGVGEHGEIRLSFEDVRVTAPGGYSIVVSGDYSLKHEESVNFQIVDFQPVSVTTEYGLDFAASVDASQFSVTDKFPIYEIEEEPIVADIGVPILILPVIEFGVKVQSSANTDLGVSGKDSIKVVTVQDASGIKATTTKNASISGTANLEGVEAELVAYVELHMLIDAVAGPFLEFGMLGVSAEEEVGSSEIELEYFSDEVVGADFDLLGYDEIWAVSKTLAKVVWGSDKITVDKK